MLLKIFKFFDPGAWVWQTQARGLPNPGVLVWHGCQEEDNCAL